MYYHFNAVKHFIFCLDLLGAIEINLTYLRDSTLLFSSYSCSLIASCTSLLDMLLFCMTFFFFLLTCEKQICDTIKHSTVRQTRTTQLWAWNENHAPLATGNQWARQSWKNIAHVCEYICILQRCKKRCTLHPPPQPAFPWLRWSRSVIMICFILGGSLAGSTCRRQTGSDRSCIRSA